MFDKLTFWAFECKPLYRTIELKYDNMRSKEGPDLPIYEKFIKEIINPEDPPACKFDNAKKRKIKGSI